MIQVLFQSGSQRFSTNENGAINSSQVLFSPSVTQINPFKAFTITHSSHQLMFANSSLVTMDNVPGVSQLKTSTGLKTSKVSDYTKQDNSLIAYHNT